MIREFICAFSFCFMILVAGSDGAWFPYLNFGGTTFFGLIFLTTGAKFLP